MEVSLFFPEKWTQHPKWVSIFKYQVFIQNGWTFTNGGYFNEPKWKDMLVSHVFFDNYHPKIQTHTNLYLIFGYFAPGMHKHKSKSQICSSLKSFLRFKVRYTRKSLASQGRKFQRKKPISQRQNLPIECAQGDQPLRCPNQVFERMSLQPFHRGDVVTCFDVVGCSSGCVVWWHGTQITISTAAWMATRQQHSSTVFSDSE